MPRWFAIAISFAILPHASAADPVLRSLKIDSGRLKDGAFHLVGRDAWQQLVISGETTDGKTRDLTRKAKYAAIPADIVDIDATGLVTPKKEGQAKIQVAAYGKTAEISVQVSHLIEDYPINFTNQVVPLFTKFGCNGGGCHGKSGGQSHFALSLLGFEPDEDYEFLIKETRGGRRILHAAPDASLLLRKATGSMPHGGGSKIEIDSPYYKLLRRWIAQGTPFGRKTDAVVTRIEVTPRDRTLEFGEEQQLVVVAHMNDGSTLDVTRMTQFEVNDKDLGEVSGTGLVTASKRAGSVAAMVRYQTFVDVFRAVVPLGQPVANLPKPGNFIDEHVFNKLKQLGLPASPVADDATFLRRATIDIAGRLPTLPETKAFLADTDPARHEKLIDRLLATPDYGFFFANKWGSVLRNRRKADGKEENKPTVVFHEWLKKGLDENKPFDYFVREILTAKGPITENPAVAWYREVRDVSSQVEDAAQLLLGQRIGCARCHHHPFEKWSQQDYYGLAAFFSRVDVRDLPAPKKEKDAKVNPVKPPFEVQHKPGVASAVNPRTKQAVLPTGLGEKTLKLDPATDPRGKLVEWMTGPENPYFARTLANRYWKHFLGRGLVEPEDDMRVTNPPTNPELLDALAKHVVDTKFDLKKLVRTICTSMTYRLSAFPNEFNADDRQNYSRFQPRRLFAEVFFDAIDDVANTRSTIKGAPANMRAVHLPDTQFDSYFLAVFGRPDATSACECERSGDASLAQLLHLLNSSEMQTKIAKNRADQLAKDKRGHEEKLNDLYLIAFSRLPTADEMTAMKDYIDKRQTDLPKAYTDIVWSVLNTKEFMFNH